MDSTVTFYHVNNVSYDHWIGFDSSKHANIISALESCGDDFTKDGTFERIKAQHFTEIAHAMGLGDMAGVSVYLPDAYNEETEKTLLDALSNGDWLLFLKTLDIENDKHWFVNKI